MRDTQVRILTVLTALLAVAGAVWLFGGTNEFEEGPWDPAAAEPIWELQVEAIQEVLVRSGDAQYVLRRNVERWELVEPVSMNASPQKVGVLLDDLTDLDLGIPVTGSDPSEYGLSESERAHVELTLKGGRKEVLWVGDTAPIGWRTYVQRPGGPIVVVPGRLNETVAVNPILLRDVAFMRYDVASLSGIRVSGPEGELNIFKDEDGWWVRDTGRVDLQRLDSLAIGLANLRIEGWLDGIVPGPIDDALFDVRLSFTDGTENGFQVGPSLPMGRLIRLHNGMTGHVKGQVLALLQQGPRSLADRNAFPFSESETKRVVLYRSGQETVLEDSGAGWRLNGGVSGEVAVAKLSSLQAIYEKPDGAGTEEPLADLVLEQANGERARFSVTRLQRVPDRVKVVEQVHSYAYFINREDWDGWIKSVGD